MGAADMAQSAEQIVVTGGWPLNGTVRVPAAKNSVLPLLAAALLCQRPPLRGFGWLLLGLLTALLLLTATCRSATTLTTTQHLHGAANVHHDFCGVAILTGLIGPFTGTQLTFDINLRTFTQIFAGHFCQFAEQHNAVPFSLLFHLAGRFITPGFGSSQRNVGNCATIRHIAYFRVLAQITDENHLVYASAGHDRVS